MHGYASNLKFDRTEAMRFLKLLDPAGERFTFQTFADNKDRKDDPRLVQVLHGTLAQHFNRLCELNKAGAGIFVTINQTNLRGRAATDIVAVRAQYTDADGTPRPQEWLDATIEIESSPGCWHTY